VTAALPVGNPEQEYVAENSRAPMRDGTTIAVRIHKPRTVPPNGSPGLVMFHGGGFCLGDLDNETELCRRWTDMGGVAINVDYRLAPEFPFPLPVYDAYDALKWVCCACRRVSRLLTC
jgi:acetyl esterase/lipase